MSQDYYVFSTLEAANSCLSEINDSSWFPVVGKVKGVPAPQNTKTTRWASDPLELVSGAWAVPRIPNNILDEIGVPQAERDDFVAAMNALGMSIESFSDDDFKKIDLEIL